MKRRPASSRGRLRGTGTARRGTTPTAIEPKAGLHPRNRFRHGYDFPGLAAASPALAAYVAPQPHGGLSIDFANPAAVKALNQALLKHAYGIDWDIPAGHLCPPAPGRSDTLHHLADLLAASRGTPTSIPRGESVRVLDIGTGANCIYPLIGASEYGWSFVGTEVDPAALRWATRLAAANPSVAARIECRRQASPLECFDGVFKPGEVFDLAMCNPPYHASAAEAAAATRRKVRNLTGRSTAGLVRNFGGQAGELWCAGGETGFIRRMIAQSATNADRCRWFTTLVSKASSLPLLYQALNDARAAAVKTIDMAQGSKKGRILAWTFLTEEANRAR